MRFLDCFADAEEWDRLVPTQDPHFASAYYRAYGAGNLAVLHIENMDVTICQPFRHQGHGWVGNAYNYGGPISKAWSVHGLFFKEFDTWKQENKLNERCTLSPFLQQGLPAPVIKQVVVVNLPHLTKPKRRVWRCVEKAIEAGYKSKLVDPSAANIFKVEQLYLAAMTDKDAPEHWVYPPGFFYQVLTELGPDRSAVFHTTDRQNNLLGGGIFLLSPEVCYYHWTARKPDIPNVEHIQAWSAINWAKSKGMTYFHFGGGLKADDSLFQFKQGFSDLTMPCRRYETYYDRS
jgi:Acetyltransferase (GNAT) domain